MGTHPIFESDFDCLTDMSYGDSASELIKELSRAVDSLPHYDDVSVREIVEVYQGSLFCLGFWILVFRTF